MKRTFLILTGFLIILISGYAQTVTDYDGHVYDTVMIAGRSWLMQNLRTTHYKNGVEIPHVSGGTAWASLTTGARCYYDNDSAAYDSVYGVLYNWYAVNNTNGICPDGWHVPSNTEWIDAEDYLGGAAVAGGKMKEEGTLHWLAPNAGATNSSRFTGLPGGALMTNSGYTFQYIQENSLWWTSTAYPGAAAWGLYFWYMYAGVDHNPVPKNAAQSIRCIKDIGVGVGENTKPAFRIYPNPAARWIMMEIPGNAAVDIVIYTASGNTALKKHITSTDNMIDLGELAAGIYVAELSGDFPPVRLKLIRE